VATPVTNWLWYRSTTHPPRVIPRNNPRVAAHRIRPSSPSLRLSNPLILGICTTQHVARKPLAKKARKIVALACLGRAVGEARWIAFSYILNDGHSETEIRSGHVTRSVGDEIMKH
jgi:hypothetical protein